MTGERLREILKKTGKSLAEISRQMEMSSQGLNTLFKAADVRTGTLEKLCARLDMDITDFIPSERVERIGHSVDLIGNGNYNINNTTSDATLVRIIDKQADQLTTSQKQISDLIDILKTK